jgi:hypothetical protein
MFKADLDSALASCEGSEPGKYNHTSRHRPAPTERLCGWSYNASGVDKRSAQITRTDDRSAGSSYEMRHA